MAIQQQSLTQPESASNVNKLGFYLDGWADLVENMGEKGEAVRNEVYQQLVNRHMPEIEVKSTNGIVGALSRITTPKRRYTITTTAPGATTAIYVGEHGRDLYVSWKTFIRPTPHWIRLAIMMSIASIFGLCNGISLFASVMEAPGPAANFGQRLMSPLVVLLSSGLCFLGVTAVIFLFEALAVAVAGYYLKQNPLYFFTYVPNIFDAEDITAMSLSAHKSLENALDKVGIDTTMLRRKQDFQGGRQGETV
jgi:hypothetical protein